MYAESFTERPLMSAPVMSRWSIFLLAFLLRFSSSFLFSAPEPLSLEVQTFIFAILYGIFATLPKVLYLWCAAKYFPQYLLEIFIVCLGFLAAATAQMLFLEDINFSYGCAATVTGLSIILFTYHLLIRKIKIKMGNEQK